jgi:hypothetical protein
MDPKSWTLSLDPATHADRKLSENRGQTERRPEGRLSVHQLLIELDGRSSGDETPHDSDDREHEKNVNEAAANVEHHEAEQPQNEEYYRNCPQHVRAPRKKD